MTTNPESYSLSDHFPGFRWSTPDPELTIRPHGRAERFCAYRVSGSEGTPVHFHTMVELTLVVAGTGSLRIGGRRYPVGPGLVALAPSNVLHGQESTTAITKYVCIFDPSLVDGLLTRDRTHARLQAVGQRLSHAAQLDETGLAVGVAAFEELLDEYAHPDRLGSGTMTSALLAQLLTRFVRAVRSDPDGMGQHPAPGTIDHDLVKVLGYVQEHFTKPINRASVARALGMRPEAISRLFQRENTESFSTVVQRLRLGHAVELLQGTTLSATEIATLSGFESYRTFSRAFSNTFGVAPKTYRDALA